MHGDIKGVSKIKRLRLRVIDCAELLGLLVLIMKDNILIDDEGNVRLIDFGLSRIVDENCKAFSTAAKTGLIACISSVNKAIRFIKGAMLTTSIFAALRPLCLAVFIMALTFSGVLAK